MIIRKDWLDDLNLEEPVTLDDWYNTLKLFKEEKGAEAPLSITEDFLKRTSVFISAFDITHFMFEDDKKVKYGPAEPIYRDYLEYMNKLYSEKLLDNDFAVLDNSAFSAKVLSNQTGIWSGYTSSHLGVFHDQLHEKDPDSEFYPIGIANPVREEGQGLKYRQATYPIVGHGTAITVDCEDIDAACKFLDYGYSDEGSMLYNWGPEGEAYEFVDTWPKFTEKILNDPDGLTPTGAFGKYRLQNGPFVIDHWTRLSSKGSYNTPESIDAMIVWEDENGDSPSTLPPVTLLPEESQEYANKFNEIETYVSEMFTKFVMGDVPLSEFDKYIENLEKMGINDVIDIQQKALDRYYSR